MLRKPAPADRMALVDLFTSVEVGTYIGGPRPREEFERRLPEDNRRPGLFAVEHAETFVGIVTLDPIDPAHPGSARMRGGETDLGYMFLPDYWGNGYATEACAAALNWYSTAVPDAPVYLSTQTANRASLRVAAKLGFTEVELYDDWGAEQWLGAWTPVQQAD